MIRSQEQFSNLLRNLRVHNINSHNKIITYSARLPAYDSAEDTIFDMQNVEIVYNSTAFNATVSMVVNPYSKILPKDRFTHFFHGVSYRRTEDHYNSLIGIYYACRNALQIGKPEYPDRMLEGERDLNVWEYEYRNPKLVPYQLDLWRSVRVFAQCVREINDNEHAHYIDVPCNAPLL